jgi:hypothetical protein
VKQNSVNEDSVSVRRKSLQKESHRIMLNVSVEQKSGSSKRENQMMRGKREREREKDAKIVLKESVTV